MIQVLVLIYASDQGLNGIKQYEAQVIPIVRAHGGKLISAFNPRPSAAGDSPDEAHLLAFPSEAALTAYRSDPRVIALAAA